MSARRHSLHPLKLHVIAALAICERFDLKNALVYPVDGWAILRGFAKRGKFFILPWIEKMVGMTSAF